MMFWLNCMEVRGLPAWGTLTVFVFQEFRNFNIVSEIL